MELSQDSLFHSGHRWELSCHMILSKEYQFVQKYKCCLNVLYASTKNVKSVTIRLEFGAGVRQQCHARFSKVQRTGYIITRILQGLHYLDIGTGFDDT